MGVNVAPLTASVHNPAMPNLPVVPDVAPTMPTLPAPYIVPPSLFGRYSFERRLQIETLNAAAQPLTSGVALPSLASPRQLAFAERFAQASPRPEPSGALAAPFGTPRVHYSKGAANSPRYHSHFTLGSSPCLKAGTRMGWFPSPAGGWAVEEPSHHRF